VGPLPLGEGQQTRVFGIGGLGLPKKLSKITKQRPQKETYFTRGGELNHPDASRVCHGVVKGVKRASTTNCVSADQINFVAMKRNRETLAEGDCEGTSEIRRGFRVPKSNLIKGGRGGTRKVPSSPTLAAPGENLLGRRGTKAVHLDGVRRRYPAGLGEKLSSQDGRAFDAED